MRHAAAMCTVFAMCAAAACARPPVAAVIPVQTIAVFAPNNRTGDPLLIAGASFLEKYVLPAERYTVADALAAEARVQLARRGFAVAPPELVARAITGTSISNPQDAASAAARAHLDGAVLYMEIRRWEADASYHPGFVIAAVGATLIDPSTGRVLWSVDRPSRPVQTPGVVSLGDAYAIAARVVIEELLAGLAPKPASSSP